MFSSRSVKNIEKISSSIGQPHHPLLGTDTTAVCAFDVQKSEPENVTVGIGTWVSKPSANSIDVDFNEPSNSRGSISSTDAGNKRVRVVQTGCRHYQA